LLQLGFRRVWMLAQEVRIAIVNDLRTRETLKEAVGGVDMRDRFS